MADKEMESIYMTKDESGFMKLDDIFKDLAIDRNDELGKLIMEIYYSGYNDGFQHAKFLIRQCNRNPDSDTCRFFAENMPKILKHLDAIQGPENDQVEKTDDEP